MSKANPIIGLLTLIFTVGLSNAWAQSDESRNARQTESTQTQASPSPSPRVPRGQAGGMNGTGDQVAPYGGGMVGMVGGETQAMMMRMMRERMAHDGMGPSMGMMRFDHIEGRIAFLKAELGITEAQQPKWSAFADALRAQADKIRTLRRQKMEGGVPEAWPDRLAWEAQALSARLDAVKAIEGPARDLYAALSSDQQKKANELLGHPMGGM